MHALKFLALVAGMLVVTPGWGAETALQPLLVKTPTACEVLKSFEKPNLVILTRPEICPNHNGFVQVNIPYGLEEVQVVLDGQLVATQKILSYRMDPLNRAVDQKLDMDKMLKEQNFEIKINPEIQGRASQIAEGLAEQVYAEAYQTKIRQEQIRIKDELFPQEAKNLVDELEKQNQEPPSINRILAQDERIYLFVSSSIPTPVLRRYAEAFDKAGDPQAVMVLRGMINGAEKLAPTIGFLMSVSLKDPNCQLSPDPDVAPCDRFRTELIVDPLLFRRFNVQQVPTLVFAQGVTPLDGMAIMGSEGDDTKIGKGQSWAISGDASPQSMLEKINSQAQSATLEAYIKAMRAGFYQGGS